MVSRQQRMLFDPTSEFMRYDSRNEVTLRYTHYKKEQHCHGYTHP
jgi:hypothetical protein